MNLRRSIAARSGEFLPFAVTPPRLTTEPGKAAEIARVTLERLRPPATDGLVLYDIDDESDRTPDERPFPFLPTMDPADYPASPSRPRDPRLWCTFLFGVVIGIVPDAIAAKTDLRPSPYVGKDQFGRAPWDRHDENGQAAYSGA